VSEKATRAVAVRSRGHIWLPYPIRLSSTEARAFERSGQQHDQYIRPIQCGQHTVTDEDVHRP